VPNRGGKNLLLSSGLNNTLEVLPLAIEDTTLFPVPLLHYAKHPIFLFCGTKGVEAFCRMSLPGTKVVIGREIKRFSHSTLFYPNTPGIVESLFAGADVFVASSTEELFSSFLIKAGRYGLPIASLPTLGAKEYVRNGVNGYISYDLELAAMKCLHLDKNACKEIASSYNAKAYVDQLTS
jgi:glycosyltransferase involved in cell wall biosynthesis